MPCYEKWFHKLLRDNCRSNFESLGKILYGCSKKKLIWLNKIGQQLLDAGLGGKSLIGDNWLQKMNKTKGKVVEKTNLIK